MKFKDYLALLRPYHWLKNTVIFFGAAIGVIFSNSISFSFGIAVMSVLGFFAASLLSSGNYILNDLLDYNFDAKHPLKKNRVITKGKISSRSSEVIMVVLWLTGFLLSFLFLNILFAVGMAALFVSGLLYNVKPARLKDVAVVDVLMESFNNP
jgi:decaprenyl-phosphate phosphoribosyltransferase